MKWLLYFLIFSIISFNVFCQPKLKSITSTKWNVNSQSFDTLEVKEWITDETSIAQSPNELPINYEIPRSLFHYSPSRNIGINHLTFGKFFSWDHSADPQKNYWRTFHLYDQKDRLLKREFFQREHIDSLWTLNSVLEYEYFDSINQSKGKSIRIQEDGTSKTIYGITTFYDIENDADSTVFRLGGLNGIPKIITKTTRDENGRIKEFNEMTIPPLPVDVPCRMIHYFNFDENGSVTQRIMDYFLDCPNGIGGLYTLDSIANSYDNFGRLTNISTYYNQSVQSSYALKYFDNNLIAERIFSFVDIPRFKINYNYEVYCNGLIKSITKDAISLLSGGLTIYKDFYEYTEEIYCPETERDLQFFPNPTSGNLKIVSQILENGQAKIRLFDIAGRLLKNWKVEDLDLNYYDISIDEFASGMYFIEISDTENRSVGKVFLE